MGPITARGFLRPPAGASLVPWMVLYPFTSTSTPLPPWYLAWCSTPLPPASTLQSFQFQISDFFFNSTCKLGP